MIETLATFADQVTTVAREVGVEGKLGGQASVPGAAGTWKDLTDNVNSSRQTSRRRSARSPRSRRRSRRATSRDRSRSRRQAEVAALKDNINEMIRNLKDTTRKNSRAGLAEDQPREVLPHAAGPARHAHGRPAGPVRARAGRLGAAGRLLHPRRGARTAPACGCSPSYAHQSARRVFERLELGEGLVGQCAREKPQDRAPHGAAGLPQISSGLGEAPPRQPHRPAGPLRGPGQGRPRARVVRALQPDAPGVPRPADGKHRHRPATRSRRTRGPRTCSSSRSRSRASCRASRRSCRRRTRSSRRRPSCSPSRTSRSSGRTPRSSRRGRRSRRRPSSWRSRRSTSRSSSRTCRTSSGRRSTAS